MRIDFTILRQIDKEFGPMEVGDSFRKDSITIRFGYWRKVDVEKLNKLVPYFMVVVEQLVDDDKECGELWDYRVTKREVEEYS